MRNVDKYLHHARQQLEVDLPRECEIAQKRLEECGRELCLHVVNNTIDFEKDDNIKGDWSRLLEKKGAITPHDLKRWEASALKQAKNVLKDGLLRRDAELRGRIAGRVRVLWGERDRHGSEKRPLYFFQGHLFKNVHRLRLPGGSARTKEEEALLERLERHTETFAPLIVGISLNDLHRLGGGGWLTSFDSGAVYMDYKRSAGQNCSAKPACDRHRCEKHCQRVGSSEHWDPHPECGAESTNPPCAHKQCPHAPGALCPADHKFVEIRNTECCSLDERAPFFAFGFRQKTFGEAGWDDYYDWERPTSSSVHNAGIAHTNREGWAIEVRYGGDIPLMEEKVDIHLFSESASIQTMNLDFPRKMKKRERERYLAMVDKCVPLDNAGYFERVPAKGSGLTGYAVLMQNRQRLIQAYWRRISVA